MSAKRSSVSVSEHQAHYIVRHTNESTTDGTSLKSRGTPENCWKTGGLSIGDTVVMGSTAVTESEFLPLENLNSFLDKENLLEKWTLTNTPWPVLSILVVYLVFVLKLGPQHMASRSAYNITNIMRIYNLFQVLYNSTIIIGGMYSYDNLLPKLWNISCRIYEHEKYEGMANEFALHGWIFIMLKVLDLLDTVFMVFRKKDSHITFLHVYHHVAMVFFSWLTTRHFKAHQGVIPGLINLFVHVIMYSYYFLATFPKLRPYLTWKKHLTKLQLSQFVLILLYLFSLYYRGCPISPVFVYIWIFNQVLFMVLFINFYIKAYILKSDTKQKNK